VTILSTDGAIQPRTPAMSTHPAVSRFSLLRLSVPARLLLVSVAAALLWTAVLWALS
jgi:hypothetical protein